MRGGLGLLLVVMTCIEHGGQRVSACVCLLIRRLRLRGCGTSAYLAVRDSGMRKAFAFAYSVLAALPAPHLARAVMTPGPSSGVPARERDESCPSRAVRGYPWRQRISGTVRTRKAYLSSVAGARTATSQARECNNA